MVPCASLQCVHACLLGRCQVLRLAQSRPVDGPPPAHRPTSRWGCPSCSCRTPGRCCTPPASHRPAEGAGLPSESQQVPHLTSRQPLRLERLPAIPCCDFSNACSARLHCTASRWCATSMPLSGARVQPSGASGFSFHCRAATQPSIQVSPGP